MMLRSQGLTEGSTGARLMQVAIQTGAGPLGLSAPESPDPIATIKPHLDRANAQIGRWFSAPAAKLDLVPWQEAPPHGPYVPASADGKRAAALHFDTYLDVMDVGAWTHYGAVPGAHMAASALAARKDLPSARRFLFVPAFAEGWRRYGEQLADEMGLYEGDPTSRLGFLRSQARTAARLVVDTGIHTANWSFDQASAYFAETTGDAPGAIQREIVAIAATPGFACAGEIGRREIVRLRDRARSALGPRFDIRDFHAALLGEGQLPLPVLAGHVESWIAARNKVL
jgi:uncharacterized protein (DUF885 family)